MDKAAIDHTFSLFKRSEFLPHHAPVQLLLWQQNNTEYISLHENNWQLHFLQTRHYPTIIHGTRQVIIKHWIKNYYVTSVPWDCFLFLLHCKKNGSFNSFTLTNLALYSFSFYNYNLAPEDLLTLIPDKCKSSKLKTTRLVALQ